MQPPTRPRIAGWRGSRDGRDDLLLTLPSLVTLPDWSTSISGPSHATSKYDLIAMLYAEGVKKRLLMGARAEEKAAERKANAGARRWGSDMAGVGCRRRAAYTLGQMALTCFSQTMGSDNKRLRRRSGLVIVHLSPDFAAAYLWICAARRANSTPQPCTAEGVGVVVGECRRCIS